MRLSAYTRTWKSIQRLDKCSNINTKEECIIKNDYLNNAFLFSVKDYNQDAWCAGKKILLL